jgi:hypothetical protein
MINLELWEVRKSRIFVEILKKRVIEKGFLMFKKLDMYSEFLEARKFVGDKCF